MTTTVTTSSSGPFIANGITPIPFSFQSISADEIEVERAGVVVSKNTYTVVRNPDGSGTVVPKTSWGSDRVTIRSAPSFKQLSDFQRFGVFFPDMLNGPLDRMARTIIALFAEVERLRGLVEECCGEGGGDGGDGGGQFVYFPATGFWSDLEILADTALWKD